MNKEITSVLYIRTISVSSTTVQNIIRADIRPRHNSESGLLTTGTSNDSNIARKEIFGEHVL